MNFIISTGLDLHDIRDIERRLDTPDWQRRFTPAERELCDGRPGAERAAAYAKRWVAKEACMKAMGVNDAKDNVAWHEIEVVNTPSGRPTIRLSGAALLQFKMITPHGMAAYTHLSISDYYPTAGATVTIEARDDVLAFAESHGIIGDA